MLQIDINANVRRTFGKGAARSLRRNGLTPAVLYGPQEKTLALEIDTKNLTRELINLQRRNAVINITVHDGETTSRRHVIVKDVQADPIRDDLVHADFYEISLEKQMKFSVPLKYVGKAAGVDAGGDLFIIKTSIHLQGKIFDIPDEITVDVSPLNLGDTILYENVGIPVEVTLLDNKEEVCVTVQEPKVASEVQEVKK